MQQMIIQGIGYIGVLCIVVSFLQKKRAPILIWLTLGQIAFATHYALLGATTGLALNLVAITRGIVFFYKPTQLWATRTVWPYLFIIACWMAGWFTWQGYMSGLIILAMTIETIGVWRDSAKEIRWFMLGVRPLYFTYALLVGSWAGMTADVLFSITLIVSMLRYDRNQH